MHVCLILILGGASADASADMSEDIYIEISTYIDNFVSAKLNLSWQVQLN